ncbi:hypothetical protein GPL15_01870 [Clostridium sp. MCC353]|uniref:hypothetical protein n=1 Tax=Clostridium sp. MCC353 TaxID=2592646 RepID=UPI001C029096|nr:hypothetical protein [Clostridium sp. MCC353]MBT9775255.1 hypothetical protein [Clostridium sp. MCC353]
MKRAVLVLLILGLGTANGGLCSLAAQADERQEAMAVNTWDYEEEENVWKYYGADQEPVTGRRLIDGSTYFFDEEGKMLTGWVDCGEGQGETAESYTSGGIDDDIHYCTSTGEMAAQMWIQAFAPDESGQNLEEMGNWYYFDAKGRAYRNQKVAFEGNEYIFDEDGRRLTGWVYERNEENGWTGTAYVAVDEDTEEAQSGDLNGDGSYAERLFAHNPQYYLYCENGSGMVVKDAWVDAIPPGKGAEEDVRSFYMDKRGHLVSQYRYGSLRDESDWGHDSENLNSMIVADRIWPCKIEDENIGTYSYKGAPGSGTEEDGFEGFIMKASDDRYYLCENNGARLDGLFLIRKKEESTLSRFPNGIYDFSDKAAMVVGKETKENPVSKDVVHYYFAEDSQGDKTKGKGVTGVFGGRLYYQGMAVGADGEEPYELVFIPEIASQKPDATGLFLVDREGNVKSGTKQKQNKKGLLTGGTKYRMDNGYTCRVCSPAHGKEDYGYDIYIIDRDLDIDHDPGVRLGAEDASYIYLKEAEE